ncbi:MAG TPA: FecR family protein [Polyangiaceae bacterium]|nr:FecR family protein [Polyangiaceae bacterium]
MSRAADVRDADRRGLALGRIARGLDGTIPRPEELAARQRFLVALGKQSRPRTKWALPAAATLAVAAIIAFVLLRSPASLDYHLSGPLVSQGNWLSVAPNSAAGLLEFSEGTQIELGPGSKGRVAEVSPRGARVVLASGRLQARVMPRPRARWSVAAGPYVVEVTGTAFDVGWSTAGEQLELSLHDGSVIVRGPSLRDGIAVSAGQRLVANARTGGVALSSLLAPRASAESAPESTPEVAPPPDKAQLVPSIPATPSWSQLVADGDFGSVLQAARAKGLEQSLNQSSLKDLVALSDAARYLGNRDLARRALLAQRSRFRASGAARGAAFLLGRMADDAGSSSEALNWYETYASETPNGPFASEALGRKLVVLVGMKNISSARSVAESYLKRFPRGAHAAYAKELLERP